MWKLAFAEEGDYKVEVYVDGAYAVYNKAHYSVGAAGVRDGMFVDQSKANGWVELGTYHFDTSVGQYVEVDDAAYGAVASNQHITADALRLTRVGDFCGDGTCNEDCSTCPADCPITEEVPGNGKDDDCDGRIDEAPVDTDPPDTQPVESQPPESATVDSSPAESGALPGNVVPIGAEACGCAETPNSFGMGWSLGFLLLGWRRRTTTVRGES
jgi:hypothetical protein